MSVETLPLVGALPVGVVGGLLATLGMDRVAPRIEEGFTPPRVAAGVLTDRHPDDAPERLAFAVHYVAGAGTGVLFVWLASLTARVTGGSVLTPLVAGLGLLVGMYGFFAWLVLPRVAFPDARRRTVARAWAVSAVVYVAVLVPVLRVVGRLV